MTTDRHDPPPSSSSQASAPEVGARPWGAQPAHVEAVAQLLRDAARPVEAAEVEVRLDLSPASLLLALLDLRVEVEDFTPAFGYPRVAKRHFALLLEDVLRRHPEVLHPIQVRIEQLLAGEFTGEPARAATLALGEIYELDYRNTTCVRRIDGQSRADHEALRNIAIAGLSQREELGLLPTAAFTRFAELWAELTAASAVDWFDRAFSRPLDPVTWAGYPLVERVRLLLDDGDMHRYRHYLGRQPQRDMVEVLLRSDLTPDELTVLAEGLRQASGRRWRAVARGLETALAEN